MVKTTKVFTSVWRKLKIFIATLTFLLCFPLIILLFLPIYTIRLIVNKTHALVYPQEGKILSTKSAVFASDDIYGKPRCTLLVMFVFDGTVQLSKLQRALDNFISKKKHPSSGDPIYPELQQYITKWMGFYFWKWVPKFQLKNHVKIYNGRFKSEVITEANMPMLVNELTLKPFDREQSPWETVLINNTNVKTYRNYYFKHADADADADAVQTTNRCQNQDQNQNSCQSVIFFRLHHALADGISIRTMLMDLVGHRMKALEIRETAMTSKSRSESKLKKCKIIMKHLMYPIRAPFETIGALMDSYDVNEWHLPTHKLSGELRGATPDPLSVDFIKNIKNSHGVTFAAVVLAAVTGGIRKFMIEQRIKMPDDMNCLTPLPMPGHSEKLRNHLTAAAVELPLGHETAAQRLTQVHNKLVALKTSVVPQTNYLFYPILGGLFPFMANRLFRHNFTTAIMSSFQGPEEKIHFVEHNIEDMAFAGGLLVGRLGIGISLLSYNGTFRVLVGVDKNIIGTYEEAQNLVRNIYDEFFVLRDLQIV